ncbi:PilZ domain-containing protein [Solidesulfovibrio sp.]
MALIKHRQCPHCGKTTWQEFVPQADSDRSYWLCRDCGDRRMAERVSLGQTALLHRGRVQTRRTCATVLILDISRSGARLHRDEDMPVEIHTDLELLFNPQLQPFGELAQYIPSIVRWIEGETFGLSFLRPLALSPGDILRIVKN